MTRVLRVLRIWLLFLLALVALVGALFFYYVYTPAAEVPPLSGMLSKGSIEVGGIKRTFRTYSPRGLATGAPLVVVLHGSGENGAAVRLEMGYAFDRLADEHGFAVVYPDAAGEGDWNACGTVGTNGSGSDDVGFLAGVVDKFVADAGIDPRRVFVVGSSRGGFMAIRLALEVPSRFRAVAAVSANVHTPDNFQCRPAPNGTSSVMIMNGTEDPIVPFDGGEVNLLGFSYQYGKVMSSRESGQFFADLNHIAGVPASDETRVAGGIRVEHVLWRNDARVEVELVAIHGGGHGIPQPYRRHPRILGPSAMEPNGPAVIWAFFERQQPLRDL